MAKARSRGKDARHRAGASSARRPGTVAGARPATTVVPGASEIASKMQQLADHIDHLPADLAHAIAGDSGVGGSLRPGVEVNDAGLLAPASSAKTASVVALDAFPHPDGSGRVVVRLDGWSGSLVVTLTPDRAALLANRLAEAVDKSRAWFGGG